MQLLLCILPVIFDSALPASLPLVVILRKVEVHVSAVVIVSQDGLTLPYKERLTETTGLPILQWWLNGS